MPVTSIDKDLEGLTLTLTAEYDADVKQVWELWANPRKLERWWGPPTYPCTFIEHDLTVGGEMLYKMVGDENGDEHYGRWRIVDVFLDGTISEIATKRSEYTSILDKEGFDGLLTRITAKTAELAKE